MLKFKRKKMIYTIICVSWCRGFVASRLNVYFVDDFSLVHGILIDECKYIHSINPSIRPSVRPVCNVLSWLTVSKSVSGSFLLRRSMTSILIFSQRHFSGIEFN